MARRSKIIFSLLLAFLYVVVNICPLRAEALPDVVSGSSTLADCIMSYYSMIGCAVGNSNWINTLYDAFGTNFGTVEDFAEAGYLVLNNAGNWEPVQMLGEMIEQNPAYTSLGLNEMFTVSADEAMAGGGLVAASGGSILAGSLGGVATTGTLPLLGGVTLAYWGGIGLGTLAAHALGLYGGAIFNGIDINDTKFLKFIPDGSITIVNKYTVSSQPRVTVRSVSGANNGTFLKKGSNYYFTFTFSNAGSYILSSQTYREGILFSDNNNNISTNQKVYSTTLGTSGTLNNVYIPLYEIPNNYTYSDYIDSLKNGTNSLPLRKCKDFVGENGNQEGSVENGAYVVPDIKPMIDPGTQAGKPLTLQDWLQFANGVQNNNNSNDPAGNNKDLYDNIMRNVVDNWNPNPNPNPDPDPWSPPVVTPVPDPSYPDPVPDQQLTENPQESENPQETEPLNPTDTGKPWKLPDLRQKFPFCIPWDIGKIFSKLKVNARQAPHISWRFNPPNTPIDYTFNLDLEDFETVAALLRTLELMGFIVGLAFVTRYIIGAN